MTTTSTNHLEEARTRVAEATKAYVDGNASVFDEATRLATALALVDIAKSLRILSARAE